MTRTGLAAALCLLAGCESAAEKCQQARDAAHGGFSAYAAALEQRKAALIEQQAKDHRQLTTVVEPRIIPEAQKLADTKYPRSAEAWLRASKVAYTELCAKDAECAALRDRKRDSTATLEDLAERLPLAIAARDAAKGPTERAVKTSEAAIIDPERPQLKAAQGLTAVAAEACAGVEVGAPGPSTGTASEGKP